MSAVALNASIGPLPSSLEPSRDPGRQPSGAFSFSSILKGMDQQDGPSNGGGAPAGAVESAENAGASQLGTAEESTGADPTAASDPFSIEAGLAALGYGSFDASQGSFTPGSVSQGSGASVPMQKAGAVPGTGAGSPSPTNAAVAVSTASSPKASPAIRDIASSSPTTPSGATSIESELAALGYGRSDASQGAPSPAAVPRGSPLQGAGAIGQTKNAVAPTGQAAPSSRSSPTPAALTTASASWSDMSAGQNAATSDPTMAGEPPPIGAGLSAPSYGAAETSQVSGASGQTRGQVAPPPSQVASTWRTNPTLASSSDTSAGQNAATSNPTTASEPPSIGAGLSAPGNSAAETSQVSGASGQTRGQVAAPPSQVAWTWRTNPTLASSSYPSVGRNGATGDPTTASEASSVGAGLSAPGHGAAETTQVSGASGQTRGQVAAPPSQVASTWRTNPTLASSSDTSAGQNAATGDPTTASEPPSIGAGLSALGYGAVETSPISLPGVVSQSSGASGQTQEPVAAPQRQVAPAWRTNPTLAALTPALASSADTSAGQNAATSDATTASEPPSIGAGLSALGYGAAETSPISLPGVVSQSSGASGQTQEQVAAPQRQVASTWRTNPTLAALTQALASSSDASAGRNAATSDLTTASEPPLIAAGLSAPGYSAAETSPIPLSGVVPQSSGANGQTHERVAAPQRQVASTGRASSTTSALSSASASQGAAPSGQTQRGGVAPEGVASSSARTRPGLAALGSGASDPAQGAPASGLVSQGLVSQAQVPRDLVAQGVVFQAQAQGSVSQAATSPDSVSQLLVSGDSGAGDTTQKGARVPQNPIGAQTGPKRAALSGATDIGSPPAANVTNVTDAVSNAAAANPMAADPSLGLQSLQSRTYLAMTNALPVRASGSERRPTASASAPAISTAASSPSSAATTAQPGDGEPARERASPASISPVEADATDSTAPISAASSLGVAGPGVDPSWSGLASIPLSSLADFVANQASSLTSPSSPAAPTPSAPAPQAVKELEISLDPANLGALSVKMRLANGKLSIVIGVSSSSTLAAIESERDAITARLGSTEQPLENLVIMAREPSNESSQDFAQTASGGNDASDPGNPRQAKSNDGSSGASRGDGRFTRGRNDPSAASGSTQNASGGGSGALLV